MMIFIGITFVVIGYAIRLKAVYKLGQGFSLSLKVPDRIVTSGIYRYMRHPSYFGSLLMILGLSLIEPIAGIMLISLSFFLARIVEEERILDCADYRKYKRKTGIFFPKRR